MNAAPGVHGAGREKHSTHDRRSTLRSLVRPLAPIYNTLQHASLRSSKHSRSEIQSGSRDGSRNLHTQDEREPPRRHAILVSQGYTNMCRKTVQRREKLSRHLNQQPGKQDDGPQVCDWSQVRGPKAGARNKLRPGRVNTGEREQKQKTHVALLGRPGRHTDRDKSKSACKNVHGLLKAAKICHPPIFNAHNCTLSMQFYTQLKKKTTTHDPLIQLT